MDVGFGFEGTSLRKYNTICIKTENLISFSTDNDCLQNNRRGGGHGISVSGSGRNV